MDNIPFLRNFDFDSIWTNLNEMVNNKTNKYTNKNSKFRIMKDRRILKNIIPIFVISFY